MIFPKGKPLMQHHKTLMQLVRDDWEEKRQIDDAAEERLP